MINYQISWSYRENESLAIFGAWKVYLTTKVAKTGIIILLHKYYVVLFSFHDILHYVECYFWKKIKWKNLLEYNWKWKTVSNITISTGSIRENVLGIVLINKFRLYGPKFINNLKKVTLMSDWGFISGFKKKWKKIYNFPKEMCGRMKQPFLQNEWCNSIYMTIFHHFLVFRKKNVNICIITLAQDIDPLKHPCSIVKSVRQISFDLHKPLKSYSISNKFPTWFTVLCKYLRDILQCLVM